MTKTTQARTSMWRKIAATFTAFMALWVSAVASAGETISYFHDDLVGSPVMATDVNGLQVWKETYRPYGDQLLDSAAAQNNKIWFAGRQFDDSTGFSYMGARYYDPTLGRFMAVDPASFTLDNLHSFNRYAYANNNPYKFVDPDGEFAIAAIGAALLASAVLIVGCQASGSCEQFGRAVWNAGQQLPATYVRSWVSTAVFINSVFNEKKTEDSAPAEEESDDGGSSSSSDGGTRKASPFLPDDPYSPEETSKRQSETRRQEGATSNDPDAPIPDRGPGRDMGGHEAKEGTPHTSGERNVNPNEEHSRRTKRDPGGGPKR